jgi:hypothetical protein
MRVIAINKTTNFIYVLNEKYNSVISLQVNTSNEQLQNDFASLPMFNNIEEVRDYIGIVDKF